MKFGWRVYRSLTAELSMSLILGRISKGYEWTGNSILRIRSKWHLFLRLSLILYSLGLLFFNFLILEHAIKVIPEILDRLKVSLVHTLQNLFIPLHFYQNHMPKIFVQNPYYLKDLPVTNLSQDTCALLSELLIVVLIVL